MDVSLSIVFIKDDILLIWLSRRLHLTIFIQQLDKHSIYMITKVNDYDINTRITVTFLLPALLASNALLLTYLKAIETRDGYAPEWSEEIVHRSS